MTEWTEELFIKHAGLFLKVMNKRWPMTEALVDGMVKILHNLEIGRGRVLDLFCGNGRISIFFSKRDFKATGIDISPTFIEDAKLKAEEHGVSEKVEFILGDARKLIDLIGERKIFDVVTNVWTSIGYFSKEEELEILKQARRLTRDGGILFIAEAIHADFLNLKFCPSSFDQLDDLILIETRTWNPLTSRLNSIWKFYEKENNDLKFIDEVDFEIYVYNVSELTSLLSEAGWKTLAVYGNLVNCQQFGPWTAMNLVAKAI